MQEFNYEKIKGLCSYYLWKMYHERHLEDCIQYCCMRWLEGNSNVQWEVINYCRANGIGDKGKAAARPLENATYVGLASDESEDTKENGFLFDQYAVEIHAEAEEDEVNRPTIMGRIEELLLPLHLNEETFKWVKKIYRPKLSRTNEKIFNTLRTPST